MIQWSNLDEKIASRQPSPDTAAPHAWCLYMSMAAENHTSVHCQHSARINEIIFIPAYLHTSACRVQINTYQAPMVKEFSFWVNSEDYPTFGCVNIYYDNVSILGCFCFSHKHARKEIGRSIFNTPRVQRGLFSFALCWDGFLLQCNVENANRKKRNILKCKCVTRKKNSCWWEQWLLVVCCWVEFKYTVGQKSIWQPPMLQITLH